MGNKPRFWCMATFLLLSANAVAKHNKDAEKIPFKLYRNHMVVASGRLGQIKNRNLLIDTGANPTIVDEALAHELGLRPIGRPPNGMAVVGGVAQTYYAVLPSFDLGSIHREALVVAVANLSLMQANAGLRIDAIVGLDALSPASFQIDYASGKMIIGSVPAPASAVPMVRGTPFAVVEGTVNGTPVTLAIDTGTSQLVLFRNGLPDAITSVPVNKSVQLSNLAGDVSAPQIQLTSFSIGSEDLSGSTAVLTTVPNCCEFQGVLGISALQFRRITFDFQRGLLGLELMYALTSLDPVAGACSGFTDPSCRRLAAPGFINARR